MLFMDRSSFLTFLYASQKCQLSAQEACSARLNGDRPRGDELREVPDALISNVVVGQIDAETLVVKTLQSPTSPRKTKNLIDRMLPFFVSAQLPGTLHPRLRYCTPPPSVKIPTFSWIVGYHGTKKSKTDLGRPHKSREVRSSARRRDTCQKRLRQ
eukprot:2919742-Rhodomonas_salina.2